MHSPDRRLSVAPMMDWTDRHCRYFHRMLSRRALLYTEMVTAKAVIHGNRARLLGFHPVEHPVALQLGGSDPAELAEASRIAAGFGYDEINLNVGCPSDRVQSGAFGAVLMQQPDLVAECVAAMQGQGVEVTVKCRIGVDKQIPAEVLPGFIEKVAAAGVKSFTIHARMAWLEGLSPKQNRDIPPLDYALVYAMKNQFPKLEIAINGGIKTLDEALAHLEHVDGVMIGRAAYHTPFDILGEADSRIFAGAPARSEGDIIEDMCAYIEIELAKGARLNQITRHMLGAFAGRPGARRWRRILSEGAHLEGAGPELVREAFMAVKGE
ncbi:MAG: tRNA dihydrouridine(20/20a) synthase DusA [Rhodobacteraceae bacterium]|nr:tRNA dihydrouridine(20/20a) synthase DusA [Paracoccaceae bacterium]